MTQSVPGAHGGDHPLLKWIDTTESYGRDVVRTFLKTLPQASAIMDIGAGDGADLEIAKSLHPNAQLIGVDFNENRRDYLKVKGIRLLTADLERDELSVDDESVDVIIANQIFEHVKELFWLNHQIARKLKPGGHLFVGVPNIATLHNRLLFLFGRQPTQMKSYSAHIRGFTKSDIQSFMDVCFPGGYSLEKFGGSQFYPLPSALSRAAAGLFPNLAFSIFFLFKKTRTYRNEFLAHPVNAKLETNFYLGPSASR
jgi:SAM-dependent methyltransferase